MFKTLKDMYAHLVEYRDSFSELSLTENSDGELELRINELVLTNNPKLVKIGDSKVRFVWDKLSIAAECDDTGAVIYLYFDIYYKGKLIGGIVI